MGFNARTQFKNMGSCFRVLVKIVAVIDLVLTLGTIFLIFALIKDLYILTPPLLNDISKGSNEREDPSRPFGSWMDAPTFEEKTRLMQEEHERTKQRHEKMFEDHGNEPARFLKALALFILWGMFSVFLAFMECVMVLMDIILFKSAAEKTHRNDSIRYCAFWALATVLFICLCLTDLFLRQAPPEHFLFQIATGNIAFRILALLVISAFANWVRNQHMPGDNQKFHGVGENEYYNEYEVKEESFGGPAPVGWNVAPEPGPSAFPYGVSQPGPSAPYPTA